MVAVKDVHATHVLSEVF